MSYVISKNYSVLNRYEYDNKSKIVSALDWLSTPCREVFGGRKVNLSAQTFYHPLDVTGRITTLFFSVLIFPVAVVSIAALLIKLATFPFIWEKKIVIAESKKTWDVIEIFNKNVNGNQYDVALENFKQRPEILSREEIYKNMHKIVKKKVEDAAPWNQTEGLLRHLNKADAVQLIKTAVKLKIDSELADNYCRTTGSEVLTFMINSLQGKSFNDLDDCIQEILTSSLQLRKEDEMISNAVRLDIINEMLLACTKIRKDQAKTQIERQKADLQEQIHRSSIYLENHSLDDLKRLQLLIKEKAVMEKASHIIKKIRFIQRHNHTTIELLKNLHEKFKNERKINHCNDFCECLKKFLEELKVFNLRLPNDQQKFVNLVIDKVSDEVRYLIKMTKVVDVNEYDRIEAEYLQNMQGHKEKIRNFAEAKIVKVPVGNEKYEDIYLDVLTLIQEKKLNDLLFFFLL